MPKKRTTNRDHAKRHQRPMMEDREIATTSRASHASTNRSREILSWFGNEG